MRIIKTVELKSHNTAYALDTVPTQDEKLDFIRWKVNVGIEAYVELGMFMSDAPTKYVSKLTGLEDTSYI